MPGPSQEPGTLDLPPVWFVGGTQKLRPSGTCLAGAFTRSLIRQGWNQASEKRIQLTEHTVTNSQLE